ncbi:MAG: hypothetical protein ACLSX5_05405 [Lachnospiraceae bacterium]
MAELLPFLAFRSQEDSDILYILLQRSGCVLGNQPDAGTDTFGLWERFTGIPASERTWLRFAGISRCAALFIFFLESQHTFFTQKTYFRHKFSLR